LGTWRCLKCYRHLTPSEAEAASKATQKVAGRWGGVGCLVLLLLLFVSAYFKARQVVLFLVMTPLVIFILVGVCYAVGGLIWMHYCLFKESEGTVVWRIFATVCKSGIHWAFVVLLLVVGLVVGLPLLAFENFSTVIEHFSTIRKILYP
jgi:hypothetical protein